MARAWIIALFLPLLSIAATASLGDNVATVQNDSVHMHASVRVLHLSNYEVHEVQGKSGTVREYVSPDGTVFAVAWQGAAVPDMKQVLGSYFDQFQQAARAWRVRRGPLVVQEPGLVVKMGGHMRAFSGQAYVPQFMPQGVREQDVK
jgi:hypothetical protein